MASDNFIPVRDREPHQLGWLHRSDLDTDHTSKDIDVRNLLRAWRERPRKLIDPDDPRTWPKGTDDERLAEWLREHTRRIAPAFRPVERIKERRPRRG